jgi:DNA invertase Pin-like site-specific DNA recombinase
VTTDAAAWYRVSTYHQDADNQVPDVEQFAAHRDYRLARKFEVADSAFKNGGGPRYKREYAAMLQAAHRGEFKVLIVWALDRIIRDEDGGAEAALRLVRQLRQRGCVVVSVKEDWLNGSSEVQDVLLAFAGWRAQEESRLKSLRVKAGVAKRRAAGLPVGRLPGAKDRVPRRRSGYVARWENEHAAKQS